MASTVVVVGLQDRLLVTAAIATISTVAATGLTRLAAIIAAIATIATTTVTTVTTVAAITTSILGILSRPDALKKAQAEMDKFIKPGHLPEVDDRDSLPYVTAIVKESLRWKEVAPIGA